MRHALGALSIMALAAASAQTPTPPELERAQQAAKALATELMGRLTAELKAGGPPQAVQVCSEIAPAIAAAHSKDGLTIRRVSARPRNPASRPDGFEVAKLAELEAAQRAGKPLGDVVEWQEVAGVRTLRFMRPIVVAAPCLACHGDPAAIDPEVKRLLAERYPDDQAVGYKQGDFRGAISVTVRAGAPAP